MQILRNWGNNKIKEQMNKKKEMGYKKREKKTRGERKICIIFEPESLHILVLYLGHIAVQFLCSKEFIHTLNSIIQDFGPKNTTPSSRPTV